MSLLAVSLVLVILCVLCRYLIRRLVQSNSTLALLWYDVLLEPMLNILTRTTRPQVTSDYLFTCPLMCENRYFIYYEKSIGMGQDFSIGSVLVSVCSIRSTDQSFELDLAVNSFCEEPSS